MEELQQAHVSVVEELENMKKIHKE